MQCRGLNPGLSTLQSSRAAAEAAPVQKGGDQQRPKCIHRKRYILRPRVLRRDEGRRSPARTAAGISRRPISTRGAWRPWQARSPRSRTQSRWQRICVVGHTQQYLAITLLAFCRGYEVPNLDLHTSLRSLKLTKGTSVTRMTSRSRVSCMPVTLGIFFWPSRQSMAGSRIARGREFTVVAF